MIKISSSRRMKIEKTFGQTGQCKSNKRQISEETLRLLPVIIGEYDGYER